jgi:predicted NAD-dependent protein-ADP-ribosyltransferase YbiA (DUF1768 family)
MIVRIKDNLLLVTSESLDEQRQINAWGARMHGHAFALIQQDARTLRLTDRGVEAEACRLPINVTSHANSLDIQLISNLAETPFELDGRRYASVEGLWQGLKFPDLSDRERIGKLFGQEARHAGFDASEADSFICGDQTVRTGTFDHWRLMKRACFAKFRQHEPAKQALLATGSRPLTHRVRRDSRTIPGVVMADIWMKVRKRMHAENQGELNPSVTF